MLIKNGWPPEQAFNLPDEYRAAFCVICGELDGGKFDWNRMAFEEPEQ